VKFNYGNVQSSSTFVVGKLLGDGFWCRGNSQRVLWLLQGIWVIVYLRCWGLSNLYLLILKFPFLQVLCIQGFLTCRKHAERIILLVEMLQVFSLSKGFGTFDVVAYLMAHDYLPMYASTIKLNTLWCIYYYRIVAVDLSSHVLTKVIQGSLPIFFQYFLIQKWIVLLYSNFYFSILMRPFGTTLYYIFLSLVYTCFKVSCRPFDIFIFL